MDIDRLDAMIRKIKPQPNTSLHLSGAIILASVYLDGSTLDGHEPASGSAGSAGISGPRCQLSQAAQNCS